MSREALIASLRALSDEELVEVMSEVLPLRSPYRHEPLVESSRMFLGIHAIRHDGNPTVEAIAYPVEIGLDTGFCQSIASNMEGIDFVGSGKDCLSPFDGRRIHLT